MNFSRTIKFVLVNVAIRDFCTIIVLIGKKGKNLSPYIKQTSN